MNITKVVVALVVAVIPASSVLGLGRPAHAHHGGGAVDRLRVSSFRLEPGPQGWSIHVELRNLDSGRLEPGFGVEAKGSAAGGATFGPVALADPDADGRYEAVLPATEGNWQLTVGVKELPGGARAEPVSQTWNVTLEPGQVLTPSGTGRRTGSSGKADSGASRLPLVAVLLVALGLLGAASVVRARRREHRGRHPLAADSNRS